MDQLDWQFVEKGSDTLLVLLSGHLVADGKFEYTRIFKEYNLDCLYIKEVEYTAYIKSSSKFVELVNSVALNGKYKKTILWGSSSAALGVLFLSTCYAFDIVFAVAPNLIWENPNCRIRQLISEGLIKITPEELPESIECILSNSNAKEIKIVLSLETSRDAMHVLKSLEISPSDSLKISYINGPHGVERHCQINQWFNDLVSYVLEGNEVSFLKKDLTQDEFKYSKDLNLLYESLYSGVFVDVGPYLRESKSADYHYLFSQNIIKKEITNESVLIAMRSVELSSASDLNLYISLANMIYDAGYYEVGRALYRDIIRKFNNLSIDKYVVDRSIE